MGRHIGSHTDSNSRCPVDQKVRYPGRKHRRLLLRLVEVRREINRVLVDIRQHLHRYLRQARFRITHGGRRISVYGAEITVPVYERIVE